MDHSFQIVHASVQGYKWVKPRLQCEYCPLELCILMELKEKPNSQVPLTTFNLSSNFLLNMLINWAYVILLSTKITLLRQKNSIWNSLILGFNKGPSLNWQTKGRGRHFPTKKHKPGDSQIALSLFCPFRIFSIKSCETSVLLSLPGVSEACLVYVELSSACSVLWLWIFPWQVPVSEHCSRWALCRPKAHPRGVIWFIQSRNNPKQSPPCQISLQFSALSK